jgi:hypothetical protein
MALDIYCRKPFATGGTLGISRLCYKGFLTLGLLTAILSISISCQPKGDIYDRQVAKGNYDKALYEEIFGGGGIHFSSRTLQNIVDNSGDPEYIQVLRKGLTDSNSFNVIYANFALFMIRDQPEERLRYVLDRACFQDTDDGINAHWVLRYFLPSTKDNTYGPITLDSPDYPVKRDRDDAYVPIVLEYLDPSKNCSKEYILRTLAYCVNLPNVLNALLEIAINGSDDDKAWVTFTLDTITIGSLASVDAGIQDELIGFAGSDNPKFREIAAITARGMARTDGLVAMLLKLSTDKDERIRAAAIYSLCAVAKPDEAIPVAIEALNDSSGWVSEHATWGLGTIGPPAKDAVPKLRERANETNEAGSDEVRAIALIEGKEKIRKDIPPDDYWMFYPRFGNSGKG